MVQLTFNSLHHKTKSPEWAFLFCGELQDCDASFIKNLCVYVLIREAKNLRGIYKNPPQGKQNC